jgi:para-nitrobenzyl esterase
VGVDDCLALNIWTPPPASSGRPVMLWLHGGDFRATSASFAATNGQRFAEEQNVVMVAANYRLGPFGFLAHRALTLEDPGYPSSGNYGLADQRAALQWVRDNIAAFGGDPERITLFGQSAGAISTSLHLVSPASRGLFQRAIFHSGQASSRTTTLSEAEAQGEAFATALRCTDRANVLACMRMATREQVFGALTAAQQQYSEQQGAVRWGPIVDGVEVPDQPRELYRRGLFARIPVIMGAVGDEGWNYVDRSFPSGLDALQYESAVRTEFGMDADAILRTYPLTAFATPKDALARLTGDVEVVCEARRVARVLHHDGAPVYVYSFDYVVDAVPPARAFHGLDLNFVFGNNFGAPSNHVLTADDLSLFRTISTFWARFAETGDPNPRGVPVQWPPYRPRPFDEPVDPTRSDRHFVFSDRVGVASHLRDQHCNFWEPFNFRSALGVVPAAAR